MEFDTDIGIDKHVIDNVAFEGGFVSKVLNRQRYTRIEYRGKATASGNQYSELFACVGRIEACPIDRKFGEGLACVAIVVHGYTLHEAVVNKRRIAVKGSGVATDEFRTLENARICTETVVAELVVGYEFRLIYELFRAEIFEQFRAEYDGVFAVPTIGEFWFDLDCKNGA